jgi:hypothetical protein
MADGFTSSSEDDSQETAHRKPSEQWGTEDLPIAPGPSENPGNPIPVPGGPDPLDPDAPKPPPETLDEAGFSVVPGQTRVVGPPRPKHQPKSKSASLSDHSGAHIFGGKGGAERFAAHLQESVAGSQADATQWDDATPAADSGSSSSDVTVVMGQAEPPDPPPVADIPPAWSLPPFGPPPKPPRAHKPPAAPKPPQGSIEGGRRPRPAPLAVPQPPPQPEDVGDFADGADQDVGDQIGADAAGAASVGGDAIGGDAPPAGQPSIQQADDIGVGASGARTSTAFASGPSANSSANDSMRDVRDLITAFKEAIEKLSEAADKLSQATGRGGGDVDRLDV